MTQASFYQLEKTPYARVLPILLERCLDAKMRVLLRAPTEEVVQSLDGLLWTYKQESFLPHGTDKNDDAQSQPIYITEKAENPNGASLLALVEGAEPFQITEFERCLYLFDAQNAEMLARARAHKKDMEANGVKVKSWRQSDEGKWEEADIRPQEEEKGETP